MKGLLICCGKSVKERSFYNSKSSRHKRILLVFRCSCGHCSAVATTRECVCCKELVKVVDNINEVDSTMECITEHPEFAALCLNVCVLQTAYFQYRQEYGIVLGDIPVFLVIRDILPIPVLR